MHPNQPKEYDAVLGSTATAYTGGVVLGGIEGVKYRLDRANSHPSPEYIEQKIAALKDALNYGQAGLELVIQALDDAEWHIHQTGYSLLEKYRQTRVEQALHIYKTRLAQELIKCYDAGERNFKGANLSEIYLAWAELCEVNLSEANLSEAYLNKAYLIEADLSKANLNKINLSNGELSQANLNSTNLTYANLNKADLSQTLLIKANLRGADLSYANLKRANLTEAILSWTNLSETNLSGANLSNANLVGAKFTNLDLAEANLCGAKLKGINLNEVNLAGAYYNDKTDFPIGFMNYGQIRKLSP